MKKLMTVILASAAAMSASAGNFEILFGETVADPNEVYTTKAFISQDFGDMKEIKQDAHLYVRGPKGATIVAEMSGDGLFQCCGFNGTCALAQPGSFGGFSLTKEATWAFQSEEPKGTIVTASTEIEVLTTAFGEELPELSDVTVTLRVYDADDPEEYAEATVCMSAEFEEGSGIANIASDNSQTEVYTLSGTRANSTNIDTLAPGMYIVRKGNETKKVIVK